MFNNWRPIGTKYINFINIVKYNCIINYLHFRRIQKLPFTLIPRISVTIRSNLGNSHTPIIISF